MLDQSTRTAILRLHEQGHGSRAIARVLGISRGAVKEVVKAGAPTVPRLPRAEKAEPHRDDIWALLTTCKGNLVRVHEELTTAGAELSYQALTAFCRRHGIGHVQKMPAGAYHFEPGEEMQHDTSPHEAKISGKLRRVQSASLVLCHSRLIFVQLYPTFNRFLCKVFLTDALNYVGGVCGRCMIDNTHVVVLHGTGKAMVPVPEMASFAERFDFAFEAHEKGDANRSARVERPFHFIENNFLAGREFSDFGHANREAIAWCDKVNAAFNSHLHASRRDLFAAERPQLKPLPIWVPEVYALHHRIVDLEGYVSVNTNRYSVPFRLQLIGHRVEVRETKDKILIYDGPREIAAHERVMEPGNRHVTVPEHRPPRGEGHTLYRDQPLEETTLLRLCPELSSYIGALKLHRGLLALRGLLRLVRDYPRPALAAAVKTAETYGLYDIARLERMVLRQIADDYFLLRSDEPNDQNQGDGQ
jgi:transposase